MAKETANQKRKRGRTANASRDDVNASQTQLTLTTNGAISRPQNNDADDNDVGEESRPKKRGRKAKEPSAAQAEPEEPALEVEPPPKKKRGRPSLQKAQEMEREEIEEPLPEEPKPKRRGRPAAPTRDTQNADEEDLSGVAQNKPPKKRGRPFLNRSQESSQVENSPDTSQVKKRGRPRQPEQKDNTEVTADEADNEGHSNSSLLRRSGRDKRKANRRQPTPEAQSEPDEVEEEPDGASSPRKGANGTRSGRPVKRGGQGDEDKSPEEVSQPKKAKKRGRPSLQAKADDAPSATEAEKSAPSKRGRRSNDKGAPDVAPNKQEKKRRGRPSLNQDKQDDQDEPVANQKSRRGRKNRQAEPEEQDDAEAESAQEDESSTKSGKTAIKRGRKRRTEQEDTRSQSSSPEPAPYRHLAMRTRKITRQVIQEKWSPLDPTSVEGVSELLQMSTLPVLLRLNNLTKHSQATAALNAITNKLRSKLTRGLPFPPATTSNKREDELSYETTLDGIQNTEAQLDPLIHSVALLRKEKERAEKELDQEYKLLNSITANARSEIRGRREQLRKIHPLVPELKHDTEGLDVGRRDEFCPIEEATGKTFVGLEDEELLGLTGQLGNHMESMRGNLQQIEGVAPAIAQGRAALKLALMPHLDQDTFEQVVLG
ncbi:hypothetical protein PFICI_08538 [Pestalotiopsis fici W106-1]|uniref:Kinetochore protein fta7 n=1 Tax=Pestalotiopsis fici (strain W106-1 / CGMCC3.15140) TaxID=1229662 RepID=W3WXW9_PESFW|nr:uncharacterized protein PFICI_08538 [Pestalotiopsis fici W106-1]ETS78685.1 hypothetical protein PFICI_08538 [Pestalotiopsis fici W106-1]